MGNLPFRSSRCVSSFTPNRCRTRTRVAGCRESPRTFHHCANRIHKLLVLNSERIYWRITRSLCAVYANFIFPLSDQHSQGRRALYRSLETGCQTRSAHRRLNRFERRRSSHQDRCESRSAHGGCRYLQIRLDVPGCANREFRRFRMKRSISCWRENRSIVASGGRGKRLIRRSSAANACLNACSISSGVPVTAAGSGTSRCRHWLSWPNRTDFLCRVVANCEHEMERRCTRAAAMRINKSLN